LPNQEIQRIGPKAGLPLISSLGTAHETSNKFRHVDGWMGMRISALLLKACHKKQEKFNPTLEALDGKEP
jgi:hypothetical protein